MKNIVENNKDIYELKIFNNVFFYYKKSDKCNYAKSEDKSIMLFYLGKIYDTFLLKEKLLMTGYYFKENANLAELFLNSYRFLGIDSLCGLNGIYAIVIWDQNKKLLIIINDRCGLKRIFYWDSGTFLVLSTEIKAISQHPYFKKTVDIKGISNLLVFGHIMDDRTLFKDINLLPYASILIYDGNEIKIKKYWDYTFYDDNEPIWLEDHYVDGLAEVIEKSIRKMVKGINKLAIPLSGGLDSRVIAGMLKKIGFNGEIITFSYGNKEAFDVIYGKKIAKQLGYPNYFLPIKKSYLKDYASEFVRITEGMISCKDSHICVGRNFINGKDGYPVVTGYLGDIQTGSIIMSKSIIGVKDLEDIIHDLYKIFGEIMTEDDLKIYLKEDIYKNISGFNYVIFRETFKKTPSKNKFYMTRYVNLIQRQRRYTSFNINCYNDITDTIAPFIDREVIDFNLHIPPSLAIDQNVYKKMIIKHLSEVAGVSYNYTRRPLYESRIKAGLRWRWERFLKYKLPPITFGRYNYKYHDNYIKAGEAISTDSKDFIKEKLGQSSFLKEYFIHEKVMQIYENHVSGNVDAYSKICVFLTLAIWAEQYLYN
jgi:asparagine synthetase B (glutamine-hydrolysing)